MALAVTIPARFNGPPDSGHGGYSCGVVANLVDAAVVEVTLRAPPPLERELPARRQDGAVLVDDGGTLVAEGRPAELDIDVPEPVSLEQAEAANRRGLHACLGRHPFPTCVACGPEREPGDGFRIFAGEVTGRDVFASDWTPDPTLGDEDGIVRDECVWAGLDCPSAAPAADPSGQKPVVLARLTGSLDLPVRVHEPHVLVSWLVADEGRKRHTGVALYTAGGDPLARGRALWIELRG